MWLGDWQWFDAANIPGGLDWIAFVLGGVGLGFALWQLARSKGALRAAREALDDTRAVLVRNQLTAVLPAFEEISARVDFAMATDNRGDTEQALARFCYRSAETIELIESDEIDGAEIVGRLKAALIKASQARTGLYGRPGASTDEVVGEAAEAIRDIAPDLRGLEVRIRNDVRSGKNA